MRKAVLGRNITNIKASKAIQDIATAAAIIWARVASFYGLSELLFLSIEVLTKVDIKAAVGHGQIELGKGAAAPTASVRPLVLFVAFKGHSGLASE